MARRKPRHERTVPDKVLKAAHVLRTYNRSGWSQENIVDLLVDIHHYCDKHKLDFGTMVFLAEGQYRTDLPPPG